MNPISSAEAVTVPLTANGGWVSTANVLARGKWGEKSDGGLVQNATIPILFKNIALIRLNLNRHQPCLVV
ncbi:MAG: hypothetical protein D3903_00285 [Candidatus Electrothrix sp. GM3_4]|nr:hypothetical protein [Candidatus Electrothrix sp. GM3_4]